MLRIQFITQSDRNHVYRARQREISIGTVWMCGKCDVGELGLDPETGQLCPHCGARVEEVIRESSRRF
jgi:rubrerythrin